MGATRPVDTHNAAGSPTGAAAFARRTAVS
jgi:hypothetical protein